MNQPNPLTLEQEFNIRVFADQVKQMSPEETKEYIMQLYEQMMIKEIIYRDLLKAHWELN